MSQPTTLSWRLVPADQISFSSTLIREAVPRCAPAVGLLLVGTGVVGTGVVGTGVVGTGVGVGLRVLVGLLVGLAVGEGDFRAVFDFLAEAALDGIPASWLPPVEMPGTGVDPAFADRILAPCFEGTIDPGDVEAETCGCAVADGDEPWAFILTKSAPPPTKTSTATAAATAIARPRPRTRPAGDPGWTGNPSARNDFDRRMTRSR